MHQSVTAFKHSADGRSNLSTRQYTTNPNGNWTDKYLGRTRRDFNIYQIKDLESSTCCISNEWYTPKSAMKASCCGCWLSFYAIIIGAISLASSIGEFHEKYGHVECSKNNVDKLIEEELQVWHYWKYVSLALIVTAIIDLFISISLFMYNRLYEIDPFDGSSIKNVRLWKAKRSRCFCVINGIVKLLMIILLNIWFVLMIIMYAAFRFIVHADDCSNKDVPEEAEIKKWLFWMLIFFSVPIVCCLLGCIGTICGCISCICCCKSDEEERLKFETVNSNHIVQV